MDADHGYLDNLLKDFMNEKEDFVRAMECLKKFEKHLLLHMGLEEDYLFKHLDDYLGKIENSGLTSSAIKDHRVIIKLLEFTKKALKAGVKENIIITVNNLNRILAKHRDRELKLQYPVSEVFIKPNEWNKLLLDIYDQDILDKIKKRLE